MTSSLFFGGVVFFSLSLHNQNCIYPIRSNSCSFHSQSCNYPVHYQGCTGTHTIHTSSLSWLYPHTSFVYFTTQAVFTLLFCSVHKGALALLSYLQSRLYSPDSPVLFAWQSQLYIHPTHLITSQSKLLSPDSHVLFTWQSFILYSPDHLTIKVTFTQLSCSVHLTKLYTLLTWSPHKVTSALLSCSIHIITFILLFCSCNKVTFTLLSCSQSKLRSLYPPVHFTVKAALDTLHSRIHPTLLFTPKSHSPCSPVHFSHIHPALLFTSKWHSPYSPVPVSYTHLTLPTMAVV